MGTGESAGRGPRGPGGREGDRQPAPRRDQPQGRQGRAHQHHRRPRPHALRARRGGQPHPRRGRPGGQHHGRLDPRPGDGRHDAGLGRRHRHRRRRRKSDAMPLPRRAAEPVAAPAAARRRAAAAAARRWPQPAPSRRPSRPRGRASPTHASRPRTSARQLFAEPEAAAGAAAGATAAHRALRPAEVRGRRAPRRPASPRPTRCGGCRRRCRTCPRPSRWFARSPAPGARARARHGRLTINSLIHKMTGQVGREQAPAPAPQRRARAARQPADREPDYEDTERERVDIPAFLRRQAN